MFVKGCVCLLFPPFFVLETAGRIGWEQSMIDNTWCYLNLLSAVWVGSKEITQFVKSGVLGAMEEVSYFAMVVSEEFRFRMIINAAIAKEANCYHQKYRHFTCILGAIVLSRDSFIKILKTFLLSFIQKPNELITSLYKWCIYAIVEKIGVRRLVIYLDAYWA